jgi:DNA-binding LacI/PurR family transcriptional regulator
MNVVQPAYASVERQIRHRILSGHWGAGMRLPNRDQLAIEFNTSVFTIHRALTPLEQEGLIERKRRVGTIVKHHPAVLTCAGIYSGSGLLDEWEYAFFRELSRELQRQLGGQNVESRLFADMRSTADHLKPLPELVRAVESREIQALFVVLSDQNTDPWLARLPVTASFNGRMPNGVHADAAQLLRLGLTRLRERGCRTVGLISAIRIPRDAHGCYFHFYKAFTSIVADLGMQTRNPWVITPAGRVADHEVYGYESFRRLWDAEASSGALSETSSGAGIDKARDKGRDKHPDGLMVYPDTSARGVMTAALELGVRVPDDIKMVFHHNTGVNWLCPLPVDWVESDTSRWAAEMIRQVRQQKAGADVEPVSLNFELRTSETVTGRNR